MSFKPGDIVRVKSGGPEMTVKSVTGKDISCTWFNNGTLKRALFVVEELKPVKKVVPDLDDL